MQRDELSRSEHQTGRKTMIELSELSQHIRDNKYRWRKNGMVCDATIRDYALNLKGCTVFRPNPMTRRVLEEANMEK